MTMASEIFMRNYANKTCRQYREIVISQLIMLMHIPVDEIIRSEGYILQLYRNISETVPTRAWQRKQLVFQVGLWDCEKLFESENNTRQILYRLES